MLYCWCEFYRKAEGGDNAVKRDSQSLRAPNFFFITNNNSETIHSKWK